MIRLFQRVRLDTNTYLKCTLLLLSMFVYGYLILFSLFPRLIFAKGIVIMLNSSRFHIKKEENERERERERGGEDSYTYHKGIISISFVSGIIPNITTLPLIGCSKDVGEVGEVGWCPYDDRFTGINSNVGGVLNYHRHKLLPVQLCKK